MYQLKVPSLNISLSGFSSVKDALLALQCRLPNAMPNAMPAFHIFPWGME